MTGTSTIPAVVGPDTQIRFLHYQLPALPSGAYEITVQQTVTGDGIPHDRNEPAGTGGATPPGQTGATFTASHDFHVQGPRYGLAPTDVHATYPPARSTGHYVDTLAHVVLRRRSLPWEIDLYGDNDTRPRPVPWMALLVFHPGEVPTVRTGLRSNLLAGTQDPPVRLSAMTSSVIDGDPHVTVIDVDASTFRRIIPHRADLAWLAHVRQVSTENKELLGLADDGWFSVVIANRLPAAGANTVHLVSLEGWAEAIADGAQRTGSTPFRLVSLASWSFTAKADRGSFSDKIRSIDSGPLRANRHAPQENTSDAAGVVAAAVSSGFVPLRYDMRHGEQSVAWYRGPLTPVSVPRFVDRGPMPTVEAGLVYHPEFGMFDASYAVAWQIGRLLALSDTKFASELMRWRQLGQARTDRLVAQREASAHHAQIEALAVFGGLEADAQAWRAAVAADADDAEARRAALVHELRKLVLKIWDPDSIATELAEFATTSVLGRLAKTGIPNSDILSPMPNGKTRLAGRPDGDVAGGES